MKHAIILAGGSGTRFWPLSRKNKPKQLLTLASKQTMLEDTIQRVKPVVDDITISTTTLLEADIKKVTPASHIIAEPCRRDTGPAIALAMRGREEGDVLAYLPADAYIRGADEFRKTLEQAMTQAQQQDGIIVIGVKPDKPSTAYGYIKPGPDGAVERFTEKPDEEKAKQFIKEGCLWNAGIFVVRVGVLRGLFKQYAPEILEVLDRMQSEEDVKKLYEEMPRISFDYAVMDHAKNVHYVEADFYWNDLGSFDALPEIIEGENTVLSGELIAEDSAGNVVSSQKTVALIDCEDLIVVDTEDALLVAPKSSAQKIKGLQEKLPDELK